MVGEFPDNEWVELDEWLWNSDQISHPNDWGFVTIHCGYGSSHDQCDTSPFKAAICDDCITAKKDLMETNEEKNKRIWEERRQNTIKILQEKKQTAEEYAKDMAELRKQATLEEWLESQGVDMNEYYARKN